ncbi:MAG: metallophosphoesterase family protein [Thermoplasmata archaeon]
MRIGVISDIHSNAPALQEVLDYFEDSGVDKVIHAGDVVGYNPYPNEVIRMVKKHKVISINGNHDRAVLTMETSWFNPVAEKAILWTRRTLSEESLEYLSDLESTLRFEFRGGTLSVYHGSPFNDDEYVEAVFATTRHLERAGTDILVLGHTHKAFVRELKTGTIVNPGGLGQPRDGDWRTSLAILEPEKMEAKIVRLPYDVEAVRSRIQEVGLPPILGDRLKIGR